MLINDLAIQHKLGCHTFYANADGHHLPTGATNSPSTSVADGAPALGEISTFGYNAMPMDTADSINFELDLLGEGFDMDLAEDFWLEALFHSTSAAADTGVIWVAWAKGFAIGEAQAAVDFDAGYDKRVIFPTKTMGTTAYALTTTGKKALNSAGAFANDRKLIVGCELQSRGAATADEIELEALCLWYTRQITNMAGGVRQTT